MVVGGCVVGSWLWLVVVVVVGWLVVNGGRLLLDEWVGFWGFG